MYPKNTVRHLLYRLDILDVLRHFFGDKLRQRGKNPDEWITLCPFHNERTPSFTVTTRKQFYHCFGCGAHGDVFHFVMEYRGLEFFAAVQEVCEITGTHIASGKTKPQRARRRSRRTLRRREARHNREAQERRENCNRSAANAAAWKMREEYESKVFGKSGVRGPARFRYDEDEIPF